MSGNGDSQHEDGIIEAQRAKSSFLYREDIGPGLSYEMAMNKIFHTGQSKFQKIDVIDTYFGKTLVTDGKTQSAQFDEFVYHESLVHPSVLRAGHGGGKPAKTIFIGGGGELATARECLRHKSVERVVMVDIDGEVVHMCSKYLPEWGGEEVLNNPRFELVVGDAHKWLLETKEIFDVIIMDISDPIEAGPGIALYTKEFYEHALTRLSTGGVFVTQSGAADAVPPAHATSGTTDSSCFGPINNTLKSVFDCAVPYSVNVPSFGGDWGFVMAFQAPAERKGECSQVEDEWKFPSTGLIDGLVSANIEGGADKLRFYDGVSHFTMFALTKPLRKALKEDSRIMTRDNPIFMY